MRKFAALLLLGVWPIAVLRARVDLLLVPPERPAAVDAVELTLYLNNPTDLNETVFLPREFTADFASATGHRRVVLRLADSGDSPRAVPARSRVTLKLKSQQPFSADDAGFVSLRLTQPATNSVMFEIARAAAPIPAPTAPAPAEAQPPLVPGRHLDLSSDLENVRRHISAYDPIYFAVGWRDRTNARFQFSFKYRLFEAGPPGEPWLEQLVRDIYVAYTQTSIWDLESFSKPFYDSSYKPTLFLLHEFDRTPKEGFSFSLQAGAQHESNGKGGAAPAVPGNGLASPTTPLRHPADTRSLNTLYLAPKMRWTADSGLFLELGARASAYLQIDENPDIARYRGQVELTVRAGYDRGFQLSTFVRGDPQGHGSIEFNATWPAIQTPLLKMILPRTLGGYAQVQYFNGYGESLLDYDVRRTDQLRFGLMIVR
jgi:outer membrane phospholipase A